MLIMWTSLQEPIDTPLKMFEWCRKNINAIEFIFVSQDKVESHIVDHGLEERYLNGWPCLEQVSIGISLVVKHCFKCLVSIWWYNDLKQPTQKAIVIMDDCQPGKYIACVYDKEWFLGIILMTLEEDHDAQVKFFDEVHPKSFQLALWRWCVLGTCQPCFMPNWNCQCLVSVYLMSIWKEIW